MLQLKDLKTWVHKAPLKRHERLLLVVASLGKKPVSLKLIRDKAKTAGFREAANWNLADIMGKQRALVINTHEGWEITDEGLTHLKSLGVPIGQATIYAIAHEMRDRLKKIKHADTRAFVEETIKCHESELWRSAIIVSWIGAAQVLFDYVINNKKAEFNARAKAVHGGKWADIQDLDQLGKQLAKTGMGERGFLDALENIGVITDSAKKELISCLDRRNSCGHPTTIMLTSTTVAHHIEVLINYVFAPFAK